MSKQRETDVPKIDDWSRLLEGRVAVVTGGGDGIGGAIARLFARQRALVEIAEIDIPADGGRRAVADGTGRRRKIAGPTISSRCSRGGPVAAQSCENARPT